MFNVQLRRSPLAALVLQACVIEVCDHHPRVDHPSHFDTNNHSLHILGRFTVPHLQVPLCGYPAPINTMGLIFTVWFVLNRSVVTVRLAAGLVP